VSLATHSPLSLACFSSYVSSHIQDAFRRDGQIRPLALAVRLADASTPPRRPYKVAEKSETQSKATIWNRCMIISRLIAIASPLPQTTATIRNSKRPLARQQFNKMTRWRKAGSLGRHVATSLQLLHLLHAISMGRASPKSATPVFLYRLAGMPNSEQPRRRQVRQRLPPLVFEPPRPPGQASR
jgi:hypothetical protein